MCTDKISTGSFKGGGMEDFARMAEEIIGKSIKEVKNRIDIGAVDNGYIQCMNKDGKCGWDGFTFDAVIVAIIPSREDDPSALGVTIGCKDCRGPVRVLEVFQIDAR